MAMVATLTRDPVDIEAAIAIAQRLKAGRRWQPDGNLPRPTRR
jgi:hypothetical protein